MANSVGIYKVYPESFRATLFTEEPFRMIGLIDVGIMYNHGMERVTLAYFRSSGTNSGKIKGLWYPIVGVKVYSGSFIEFTRYLNLILTITTRKGRARKDWLAKSLFFINHHGDESFIRGFSSGKHYKSLLWIGETLRDLYEKSDFKKIDLKDWNEYNNILTSSEIYEGNKYSQRENFESFIEEIFYNY